jgi:hypothetical protein
MLKKLKRPFRVVWVFRNHSGQRYSGLTWGFTVMNNAAMDIAKINGQYGPDNSTLTMLVC